MTVKMNMCKDELAKNWLNRWVGHRGWKTYETHQFMTDDQRKAKIIVCSIIETGGEGMTPSEM